MLHKTIFFLFISLVLIVSLVSCNVYPVMGNQLGLRAATEAPASIEVILTATPSSETPFAGNEQSALIISEATSTKETEGLISTETPGGINELIATDESAAAEDYNQELSATEEPASGFWEISSPDGQLQTVAPNDWLPTDDYEYQSIFNNDGNFEGMDAVGLTSPDNKAFLYLMVYKDAETTNWSQGIVQAKVLRILNKVFTKGAGDVEIVNIKQMPDGSERLTWSSAACDCKGVIAYKAGMRMETEYLWLCNAFYINSFKNNYVGVFDYVFEWLKFPDAG